VGGAFELDHEPVEELVDLVHLEAADRGLEADLLDLVRGERRLATGAGGVGAVAEAGQVGGGPLQQAADLAGAVAADDPGEGPRPDLLGREPAFGHAASSPLALGGHASSSVYLDPVDWQTASGACRLDPCSGVLLGRVTGRCPNRIRPETVRGRARYGADRVS
jgi:hypothetical protein